MGLEYAGVNSCHPIAEAPSESWTWATRHCHLDFHQKQEGASSILPSSQTYLCFKSLSDHHQQPHSAPCRQVFVSGGTSLLCLWSAPVTPPILPTKTSIWKPDTPELYIKPLSSSYPMLTSQTPPQGQAAVYMHTRACFN